MLEELPLEDEDGHDCSDDDYTAAEHLVDWRVQEVKRNVLEGWCEEVAYGGNGQL